MRLDPLPNALALLAPAHPEKGKGKKVTIPSFQVQSPICFGTIYIHARDMAYFERGEKGKMKKRRLIEATLEVEAELEAPIGQ